MPRPSAGGAAIGFIAQFAAKGVRTFQRESWDGLFNVRPSNKIPRLTENPNQGSGWGRSAVNVNSFARLLEAYRSGGPGGWSDDRWEQTRHFIGIAYLAIHRTSEQLTQAEFQVFEKDDNAPDGKRPVSRRHPGYELIQLLEHPNREDTFGDLMYRWNQQMDLTGTALTWMVPNRLGKPYELYSIPTAAAMPSPIVNPDFPEGFYRIQPLYPYGPFSAPTPFSAAGAIIPSQWMMRFMYPHPYLRHDGYSPLTGLQLTLDVIESIYRSRWYSMQRGVNPTAILNFDEVEGMQGLPPEEVARIHAEWENNFQGVDNHGKLIIGHPGSKLEQFGTSPVDMDYANGWDQETNFSLAGFGISKPAAGMIEESSYASLFATLKQFHLLTLQPKCARFAAKLTRRLAKFFGDDLIVEVRTPRIDDHELKQQKLQMAIGAKAITYNQLLKELEFPMVKEDWGEQRVGMDEPQGQPGMLGMPGAAPPGTPGELPPESVAPGELPESPELGESADEASLEADFEDVDHEAEASRPTPGTLGEGSLGPRKAFAQRPRSALRKALTPPRMKNLKDQLVAVTEGPPPEPGELPLYDQLMSTLFPNGNGHAHD